MIPRLHSVESIGKNGIPYSSATTGTMEQILADLAKRGHRQVVVRPVFRRRETPVDWVPVIRLEIA